MKSAIIQIRILVLSAAVILSFSRCGSMGYSRSLEGDWQFVNMTFDGSEITPEMIQKNDRDLPVLRCTESEFTLDVLGAAFEGGWESTGDAQYRFFDDDLEEFTATLAAEEKNRQTLTLKDTDAAQAVTGHTMTLVFERNSGAAAGTAVNSRRTEKVSSIDKSKLDEIMGTAESMLESYLGYGYNMVYDEEGVIISIQEENLALAAKLTKEGNSRASAIWESIVDSMQSITVNLHDILEANGFGEIPVGVQCFDKEDGDKALLIVVDGKVTYDASK